MSGNGKKYTVWLHPGDREDALCISKLDGILDEINKRELKKGTLSRVIAKALYLYFTVHGKDLVSDNISAEPDKVIAQRAVASQSEPNERQLLVTESSSPSEQTRGSVEDADIKNSLINLTMSL